MSLYNSYNNEDILIRAVIAGMLDVLNNNIKYSQVWSNEEVEEISIPWFYNQSGDERFMQDFYTHYHACNFPKPVDGNFDRIPRGVITYNGSSIDANRITNRFVQGRYVKEVNGRIQSYVSFLYSIPLTVNFECEMLIDTQVTSLKVEQAIREAFYKTRTFYVYYKGLRLGCTAGFSEDVTIDKLIEYSFTEENRINLKFNIEIETYQPVFDPTTEMDANNYMRGIGYRIYGDDDSGYQEKNDGKIEKIEIESPSSSSIIPKNYPLLIEWNYSKELFIMNKVDVYYTLNGDSEQTLIQKGIDNHEYWHWNIPETFTNFKSPKIIFEEDSSTQVYRQPTISIIPDISTGAITKESFNIINPGYFMTTENKIDSSIALILEMKDDTGKTHFTGDSSIYLNLKHFTIDLDDPVWVDPSSNIIFPGTIDYRVIDIYIANSVNDDVFGVASNITII